MSKPEDGASLVPVAEALLEEHEKDQREFGHMTHEELMCAFAVRGDNTKVLERQIDRLRLINRLLVIAFAISTAIALHVVLRAH